VEETNVIPTTTSEFVTYTIAAGEQSSDKNPYVPVQYDEQKFVVKFDSSAVYKTKDTSNQYDVNKLYGFSDNYAHHQQYSARLGWRWTGTAIHLYAYVYNNGVRNLNWSKDLGSIEIGSENNCSIKVTETSYVFTLNGKTDTLPRASKTPKAEGYKLYPYFGGTEAAPHTIKIWIKELR
jgi:hypothetical protein